MALQEPESEQSNPQLSAAMRRTRTAILDAALAVLPVNPKASLSDIAEKADVGRSTLHRHFNDRTDLVRALALYVRDLSNVAIDRAEPEVGTPLAAIRRLVDGQFDLGPILVFLHEDPLVRTDPELHEQFGVGEDKLIMAITRAADPADPTPTAWRLRVFWELVRLGSDFTANGAARHEAIDAIMYTLTHGMAAGESR
ncbi:TetR/AcrR family transcriptional regulator [bacterium RCC_150]